MVNTNITVKFFSRKHITLQEVHEPLKTTSYRNGFEYERRLHSIGHAEHEYQTLARTILNH
jgi:hypothetical protein